MCVAPPACSARGAGQKGRSNAAVSQKAAKRAVGGARRGAAKARAAAAEAPVVALTKQDLVDYIKSGCKTKDQWRCARRR